jgi:hypothetical protein
MEKAMVVSEDLKSWYAISCPVAAVRFCPRTLELLDADRDGYVSTSEVLAAIDFLKAKGFDVASLSASAGDAALKAELDKVLARIADLAKLEPSDDDKKALAEWEAKFNTPEIGIFGADTPSALSSLEAVEKIIDAFFTPAEDLPLVTDQPEAELPLKSNLNPKYADAVCDFCEKCAQKLLGPETEKLSRRDWNRIKAALKPYRDWLKAKPVMNAGALDLLVEEEKLLRYRLDLGEFLENFVTMDRLYLDGSAIFQTGVLRIDAREFRLCFHVDNEAAHSALAAKSECCVIYLKLTRPVEKAQRTICAVVTAGKVGTLYVGRNGVFYDRDGKDWHAVVTKVVESQVSLAEAFWLPWKKLGESVSGLARKFLGDKQSAGEKTLNAEHLMKKNPEGGAAMASSVAAIGIGVGMIGAAAASVLAAVSSMSAQKMLVAVVVAVLAVSLPSVALAYFKLRRRDLGAILNASGWAINRKMAVSMKLAREFTKCASVRSGGRKLALAAAIVLAVAAAVSWKLFVAKCPAPAVAPQAEDRQQSQQQEVTTDGK